METGGTIAPSPPRAQSTAHHPFRRPLGKGTAREGVSVIGPLCCAISPQRMSSKMTSPTPERTKVFVSYSHDSREHIDRVLDLSNRLRAEVIDCHIDQYEESPPEGWPRWTINQFEKADFVLVVCTETYERRFRGKEQAGKGLGVKWEGAILTQELYDAEANNTKFISVVLSAQDSAHIPIVLRGTTRYDLSAEASYEAIYRRLTDQPRVAKCKT